MYRIAIDIGGTFTDGLIEEVDNGTIWVAKSLSTPASPGEAVTEVVRTLLDKVDPKDGEAIVTEIVHGNTIVTNTLIERRGVPTALLATEGMSDLIEIGREVRYDLYDLRLELPTPLVPRELRIEVAERMSAEGKAQLALTETEIERVVDRIADLDVKSVAVAFLHSNVSDAHETSIEKAIRKRLPSVAVSSSGRVCGEVREYERATTTTANAYVQPLVESYLRELQSRMSDLGFDAPIRIMVSSGGFTSTATAADVPIALLESGPAGGALSAAHVGKVAGLGNVLAFDMGGTTAKLCVIVDGQPSITHSFEAARMKRFKRGSGLPILTPSIDLIEIGAGGGSMAARNALGLIKVGPESAGSVPGPVCYGRGGTAPTVTDADLVLGYLDADNFLGGEMQLDKDGAVEALASLGTSVGLGAQETAVGIIDIVNESMAAAARVHVAEKGHDPRKFTLVATGGAGPVHALSVAQRLGVRRIAFPVGVGAGSCLGFLAAPPRADRTWSRISLVEAVDWAAVADQLARLRADAENELAETGTGAEDCNWSIVAEMRFGGQGAAVPVAMPYRTLSAEFAEELVGRFHEEYAALYGAIVPAAKPEVVTWRVVAVGRHSHPGFVWSEAPAAEPVPRKHRDIYLPHQKAMQPVPVYDRYTLPAGAQLTGPAIIEERESTISLPLPSKITVLEDRTILVELKQ